MRETGQPTTTFGALKMSSSASFPSPEADVEVEGAPVVVVDDERLACFGTTYREARPPGTIAPSTLAGIDWTPHPKIGLDLWPGPVVNRFGEPLALEELVAFSEGGEGEWERWVANVEEGGGGEEPTTTTTTTKPEQELVCWAEVRLHPPPPPLHRFPASSPSHASSTLDD